MDISFAPYLQIHLPLKRIFLWGMMGVGKSTYGKKIAHQLQWRWIDLDAHIEQAEGQSIASIFQTSGEPAFRTLEIKYLNALLKEDNVVVSAGGGTPHIQGLAERMREAGMCIWLDAPPKALVKRLEGTQSDRPLLHGKAGDALLDLINKRLIERTPSYKKAHLIVNVLKMKPKELGDQLSMLIQDRS